MRIRDSHTADMFELLPQPPASTEGSLECRKTIAGIMSESLKGHSLDRFQIAAEMSRLLGREISKHMLDAYTAESRTEHIPPLDTAMAFDIATGNFSLINFYASKLGARVSIGRDALHAELGKLEHLRQDASKRIRELKRMMGEAEE